MILSWRKQKKYYAIALSTLVFLLPIATFAAEGDSSTILKTIAAVLYTIVVAIFGWLVYLGGSLLSLGLEDYVFKFQSNYINVFGVAIDYLWSIMRDILNLTFIFGLIYIGFRLIFDAEDSRARKALVMLIGAALLVNFSLFISKTVIDFSNLAAFEMAKGITVLSGSGSTSNVATQFMQVLKIHEVLGISDNFKTASEKMADLTDGGAFAYVAGIAILFFVAAFVFAAGGFLLIVRFVALCVYMVFSPLMFLGWVIPAFSGVSRKWWSGFLNQAFVAPAYIFMLFMSLSVLKVIGESSAMNGFKYEDALSATGAVLNTNGTAAQSFAFFAVAAGFLIASLIVAKKMGAVGAGATISVGNSLRKRGQRVIGSSTVGGVGAGFRSTVGRRGERLANDEDFREKASKSWVGRQRLKLANVTSKASFDARQVGGVGKTLGIGEGKTGGYAARVAAKQKAEDDMAKMLGQVGDDDVRVMAQKQAEKDLEKGVREKRAEMQAESDPVEKGKRANELADLQEKLDKQKDKVEQEKNRRILGTSFNPLDDKKLQNALTHGEAMIKRAEQKVKDSVTDFVNATTDAERQRFEDEAKAAQKLIEQSKAEITNFRRDGGVDTGYADTVEQRGWISSTVAGRNQAINRTIGKKLRKEYSKKIKDKAPTTSSPTPPPPTP